MTDDPTTAWCPEAPPAIPAARAPRTVPDLTRLGPDALLRRGATIARDKHLLGDANQY